MTSRKRLKPWYKNTSKLRLVISWILLFIPFMLLSFVESFCLSMHLYFTDLEDLLNLEEEEENKSKPSPPNEPDNWIP